MAALNCRRILATSSMGDGAGFDEAGSFMAFHGQAWFRNVRNQAGTTNAWLRGVGSRRGASAHGLGRNARVGLFGQGRLRAEVDHVPGAFGLGFEVEAIVYVGR